MLVNLDGEPIWSPIASNDLEFAVNTNWDMFPHAPTKSFYLRHQDVWLKAAAVEGPWASAGKLPASFEKLPADDNWKDPAHNVTYVTVVEDVQPAHPTGRPARARTCTGAGARRRCSAATCGPRPRG